MIDAFKTKTINILGEQYKLGNENYPQEIVNLYSPNENQHVGVYGIVCLTKDIFQSIFYRMQPGFGFTLISGWDELRTRQPPIGDNITIVVNDIDFKLFAQDKQTFIQDLIQVVKDWNKKSIDIIVFTTDILIMTDMLKDNILIFDKDGKRLELTTQTLAANLFDVLAELRVKSAISCYATKFIKQTDKTPREDLLEYIGDKFLQFYIKNHNKQNTNTDEKV